MNVYSTTLEQRIFDIVSSDLGYLGYDLVRIRLKGGSKFKTLQIMIERKDHAAITVDDCEKASRQVSALLDVEDPIESAYNLELSSAGLNRPLTKFSDLELALKQKIKIQTKLAVNGSRNFTGVLIEYNQLKLTIMIDKQEVSIDIANILEANIVFEVPTKNKGRK